jgi:hypothetical protein
MKRTSPAALVSLFLFAVLVVSCANREVQKVRPDAERIWGAERVCLPCHATIRPIEATSTGHMNHNYRCDTCHGGDPLATTRDKAHHGFMPKPQDPAFIAQACHKCHNDQLGKDFPYDAAFVAAVEVHHPTDDGK